MTDTIKEKLERLNQLEKVELRQVWRESFGQAPPTNLRRNLIIPMLAYRIQEQAFGGLKPKTLRRLRELAQTSEADPNARISPAVSIKPGTRLVRQWQNEVHVVEVLDKSYEYRNARYKSLSQIARLITGTRWSGPLFFGLKSDNPHFSKKAE